MKGETHGSRSKGNIAKIRCVSITVEIVRYVYHAEIPREEISMIPARTSNKPIFCVDMNLQQVIKICALYSQMIMTGSKILVSLLINQLIY